MGARVSVKSLSVVRGRGAFKETDLAITLEESGDGCDDGDIIVAIA